MVIIEEKVEVNMVGELPVYDLHICTHTHTHIPLCWYSSPDFGAVQFSRWAAAFLLRGYYIAQRSCAAPFASKRHAIFRTVCPSWRYRGALLSCPTPSAPVETSTIKHMLNYDNISNIIYGCRNVSSIARYLRFYRRLPLYTQMSNFIKISSSLRARSVIFFHNCYHCCDYKDTRRKKSQEGITCNDAF